MIARALSAALNKSLLDSLDPETTEALKELLEMFEDYPGDAKADVLARRASTISCGNCGLTWEGFYLPMSASGRGLQATIRLAVCPRCYNNQSVFVGSPAPNPSPQIEPSPSNKEPSQ